MTSIIHAVRSGAVFVLNHHQQEMKKVSMRRENGKKKNTYSCGQKIDISMACY